MLSNALNIHMFFAGKNQWMFSMYPNVSINLHKDHYKTVALFTARFILVVIYTRNPITLMIFVNFDVWGLIASVYVCLLLLVFLTPGTLT